MTYCAPGYLFIGSRLGDSVFLHYTFEPTAADEPPEKKAKLNAALNLNEEDEDVELYGKMVPQTVKSGTVTEKMNIRVLDKLLNVGPCKKITAGCPSISSYFQEVSRRDPLCVRVAMVNVAVFAYFSEVFVLKLLRLAGLCREFNCLDGLVDFAYIDVLFALSV
ncbi:unnamed protein product [Gongylonema pulchrum]|uniref:Nucleotid_trans domain-containing protein n=1 Tax=Gongylonema pulchrum TaxID=637853 RepID=A0A183D930_9BILA|nr:unnamed protein product [Gongylonema pulchrum]